jgi:hypothetical protein
VLHSCPKSLLIKLLLVLVMTEKLETEVFCWALISPFHMVLVNTVLGVYKVVGCLVCGCL